MHFFEDIICEFRQNNTKNQKTFKKLLDKIQFKVYNMRAPLERVRLTEYPLKNPDENTFKIFSKKLKKSIDKA